MKGKNDYKEHYREILIPQWIDFLDSDIEIDSLKRKQLVSLLRVWLNELRRDVNEDIKWPEPTQPECIIKGD